MALENLELEPVEAPDLGDLKTLDAVLSELPSPMPERWRQFVSANPEPVYVSGRIEALETHRYLSTNKAGVEMMYGLNSGDYGILRQYNRYNGRVKKGFVPIADPGPGPTGNQIFYATGPEETGKVFYWLHDEPGPENARGSLILLANSMDDFFDRIEAEDN